MGFGVSHFHMIFPKFTASTWWNMLKIPGNPERTSRDSCWSNTSRSRAWVWNFVTWFFSHLPEVGTLLNNVSILHNLPITSSFFLAHNYRRFLYAILVVGLGNLQAFSTFALPTLPRKRRTIRNGLGINRDQPMGDMSVGKLYPGSHTNGNVRRNAIRHNTPATIDREIILRWIKSHLSKLFGVSSATYK